MASLSGTGGLRTPPLKILELFLPYINALGFLRRSWMISKIENLPESMLRAPRWIS
jgi:hypothetical protein